MPRKLFAAIGFGSAKPPYAPYKNNDVNEIYNLLFCDDHNAFKPKLGNHPTGYEVVLFSEPADSSAMLALAGESALEGRVRYLTYARLRALGQPVPSKILLGVIVEVALSGGLDVLAAFSEGGIRYINQSGKLAVFEDVGVLQPYVQRLFDVSAPVVACLGPWKKPRRSPPRAGGIRLTFLVSDGVYFGEGPMSVMQTEAMAGPVIQRATELFQTVVAMSQE